MAAPVLHNFQGELKNGVLQAWAQGARNVVMQLATGGGKTVTLSDIIRGHNGFSCVMAHRTELVGQLSLTLARYGVRHNVICSDSTRRAIAKIHVDALGVSWIDANAPCTVASVDTLVRAPNLELWAAKVTLWVVDEGHHLVLDNKWHRAIAAFTNPQVRGLLPTATPGRADRKGLGRPELGGSGVADVMVKGPEMRWLIDQGFLSDYRIICPPSDLQVLGDVAASGDWSTKQLREAAERSHIVGDVVKAYVRWGYGKLGITFATDIQTAGEITFAFQQAGIAAECLTGKTDDYVRRAMIQKFERREIHQIVAVDIVSEGFDLPAIEVLNMARPTASLPLYMQQFGRALRSMPGKDKAVIIDHAANVIRHQGPPDKPRVWSLGNREGGAKRASTGIPYRVCPECTAPYEAFHKACPYCGHVVPPAGRSSPAMVDGDLEEMDPAMLDMLRGKAAEADVPLHVLRSTMAAERWSPVVASTQLRNHERRQEAQGALRLAMAHWGGLQKHQGRSDVQMQKAFFFTFGMSTLEALALHAKDAQLLTQRIEGELSNAYALA